MTRDLPGPPKLMLITSAPWLVASVIDFATSESSRLSLSEAFSTISLHLKAAPARPWPLLPAPHARPGDVRAVPDLVVLRPGAGRLQGEAAATVVVVAPRVDDPPRQVEMRPVDPGVDHRELRPPSPRSLPRPAEALLAQVPLVGVVRRRAGVARPEGGIVGQVADGPVALQLHPRDHRVGLQLTPGSRQAPAARRPYHHRAELGDRAHPREPAAVQHGGDAGPRQARLWPRASPPRGRRDLRRPHRGDQVAGWPRSLGERVEGAPRCAGDDAGLGIATAAKTQNTSPATANRRMREL